MIKLSTKTKLIAEENKKTFIPTEIDIEKKIKDEDIRDENK